MHGKWDSKRIKKEGVVKKLNNENQIQKKLYQAYSIYYKKETAISFKNLEYFEMISYTVLQEDDASNVNVKICVGEAIDVQEDNELAYAIIQAIFIHIANNNKKYAFLILDWYYDTGRVDNFTGSKIYDLQESNNDIHSFNIIVKNPHIHFVHNCRATCTNGHSENNTEYLYNEFFYIVV